MEMLLLELLYKTDYGNDFDREVRVPCSPHLCARPPWTLCTAMQASMCMSVCVPVSILVCVCLCVYLCVHGCIHVCDVRACVHMYVWGAPPLAPPPALAPAGRLSLQGVVLCFGLCARGQVKTVLNVLRDFEERIQESELSWQIGAWRVSHPRSAVRSPGAS